MRKDPVIYPLLILSFLLATTIFSGCFLSDDAPSDLAAKAVSKTRIDLSWTDNSDRELGFSIERRTLEGRFEEIADVGPDSISYSDAGLEENTTYEYRVRAYLKIFKTFYSNIASATTSNVYLSTSPDITLPDEYSEWDLILEESTMSVPPKINIHYVPIGAIYEIGIVGEDKPDFDDDYAILRYSYDRSKLQEAGLIEDFMVFYYDESDERWKPVDRIDVDVDNAEVIAYTSHFTPFVLTAIPSASGTVADPPSCIQDDYPGGIGGSCGAVFTIVDENFKYYQDRDYFIRPVSVSGENAITFAALGFDKALGISTFNGSAPYTDHKRYDGDDYIVFTAHTDIDVYVMYDTRGGVDRFDTSEDAPWLTDVGFVNTGFFLETTDAVQYYTVYKKSYNQGEEVHLHGNRKEVTDFSIDTNYWVIVKLQGDTGSGYASDLCMASPDMTPPALVTNLNAVPGAGMVTLTWQNPDDADFAGVVIRRSTVAPPMGVADGDEPVGTVVSPQCFRDTSVAPGITYYYTVFSLDINNNYDIGESVSVTTSVDTDGDGLSDDYENSTVYPGTGLKTDPNIVDSDGDGIDDGDEISQGTDPTNPDNLKPLITDFTRTSDSPTGDPKIIYSLDGTDNTGITGWMVTRTDAKPLADNTNWQAVKPTEYVFATKPSPGTYNLYAWAKDAAGNVSDLYTEIDIEIIRSWMLKGGYLNIDPTKNATLSNNSIIVHDSIPYVTWSENSDDGYKIYVKHWDGTSWVQVGSVLATSGSGGKLPSFDYPRSSITCDDTTIFVVVNTVLLNGDRNIIVKQWDGSNWVQVGGNININPMNWAGDPSITIIGSTPYVVWCETESGSINVYVKHWDGTSWIQDGGSLNVDTSADAAYPSIIFNGSTPYVTWLEDFQVYVKNWDGTNWVQCGDVNVSYSYSAVFPAITSDGINPYIVLSLYVIKWNGSDWIQIGENLNIYPGAEGKLVFSSSIALNNTTPFVVSKLSGTITYEHFVYVQAFE